MLWATVGELEGKRSRKACHLQVEANLYETSANAKIYKTILIWDSTSISPHFFFVNKVNSKTIHPVQSDTNLSRTESHSINYN